MTLKLTDNRRRVLEALGGADGVPMGRLEAAKCTGVAFNEVPHAARFLVRAGLAGQDTWGRWFITDAGREALAALKEDKE